MCTAVSALHAGLVCKCLFVDCMHALKLSAVANLLHVKRRTQHIYGCMFAEGWLKL